jgi:hypothetical protein
LMEGASMRARLIIVTTLLSGAAAAGCFDYLSDEKSFQQDGAAGDAGAAGSTTTSPPAKCTPSEADDAVSDDCGVFVSPSGDDATGNGSQEKPYATINKALTEGTAIYACADATKSLIDAVSVEKKGVFIFGGLDCSTWKHDPATKTKLTAAADAVPLTVTGSGTLHIEDFAITAKDAPPVSQGIFGPGNSSIAIIADNGTTLEMTRCDVVAGKGTDGTAGDPAMGMAMTGPDGADAEAGCDNDQGEFGGDGGENMCAGTDASGGKGGSGTDTATGSDGSAGKPTAATGAGGLGQTAQVQCGTGGNGKNGVLGLDGGPGKGATPEELGKLDKTGFTGTSGADGEVGMPGQGGGGGGGARMCANGMAGPGGGGGGAGGCGGLGGKGGYGGGASIAIVSLGAKLSFKEVTLKTGDGANGGAGSVGQEGGPGGLGGMPGTGDAMAKACPGGEGGPGGKGGQGGGGLGGHSIGIAHTGTLASPAGVMITPGVAGKGGAGDPVDPVNNGADGVAKDIQEV